MHRHLRPFLLACGLLLWATLALARPFSTEDESWEGCSEFAKVAAEELGDRFVPTGRPDLGQLLPEDSVVLVHPTRALDVGSFSRWLTAGGRAIIFDEYGTGEELFQHFGLERVPMPDDPASSLRGNPSLAIAEPAGSHATVADVDRVVTNHAVGLKHRELSPVLKVRAASGGETTLALAGMVGKGRLLAVGDSSTIINRMMAFSGNRAFARGVLKYAGDDDSWGLRRGRVYFVYEDFDETGTFGDEPGFLSRLRWVFQALRDLAVRIRSYGLPPELALVTAFLFGFLMILWVGRIAGKTHRPELPKFTRPVPLFAQGGVLGHRALLFAPRTPRSLAMLELKSAIEEEFARLLALPDIPGHEELLVRIRDEQLLDGERLSKLRSLLLLLSEIETMMLSKHRKNGRVVSNEELVLSSRTGVEILAFARERRGAKP